MKGGSAAPARAGWQAGSRLESRSGTGVGGHATAAEAPEEAGPVPCEACGEVPELIIEVVETIVGDTDPVP